MTRPATLLILLSLLSSCTANYFITVHQDRSASVRFDKGLEPLELDRFVKSTMISNLDTSSNEFHFDISDVDSLGKYLVYHPGILQFRLNERELTISSDSVTDDWCGCHLVMQVQFDKEIEPLASDRQLKLRDNCTLEVAKSKRELIREEGKKDIRIKFK